MKNICPCTVGHGLILWPSAWKTERERLGARWNRLTFIILSLDSEFVWRGSCVSGAKQGQRAAVQRIMACITASTFQKHNWNWSILDHNHFDMFINDIVCLKYVAQFWMIPKGFSQLLDGFMKPLFSSCEQCWRMEELCYELFLEVTLLQKITFWHHLLTLKLLKPTRLCSSLAQKDFIFSKIWKISEPKLNVSLPKTVMLQNFCKEIIKQINRFSLLQVFQRETYLIYLISPSIVFQVL